MKQLLKFTACFFLLGTIFFTSCKKEAVQAITSTPTPTLSGNKPPVANAGPDKTFFLPVNFVNLDGKASTDPDNNITGYLWRNISGTSGFTISNANSAQTQVNNLVQGVYLFELKVTDAGGLFSKDTVQVMPAEVCEPLNRPVVNVSLTPVSSVPLPRYGITAASVGNKLVLAGGSQPTSINSNTSNLSSRVDIYDFSIQSWSSADISTPKEQITSATAGNKIFFAGGGTTRVDIYDALTGFWSTADLSAPAYIVSIAAVGNKVFFTVNSKVDIYDIAANSWSVANLSQPRYEVSTTVVGNKVYFAGGRITADGSYSAVIDIYDNATGAWSVSSLNQPASLMSSIFVNGKIYWAGGDISSDLVNDVGIPTCKVEIRDINTQSSSFTHLSTPNDFFFNAGKAIAYNGKIIFSTGFGSVSGFGFGFDIYDPLSNSWSIGKFPQNVIVESVLLVNNNLYAVGRSSGNGNRPSDQVWKLNF